MKIDTVQLGIPLTGEQRAKLFALRLQLERRLQELRARYQRGRPQLAGLRQQTTPNRLRGMSSAFRYTTEGPLRGPCSHKHKNLESAVDCLVADDAICIGRGGRTDRRILVVGGGMKRELNAEELMAVELYRASASRTQ